MAIFNVTNSGQGNLPPTQVGDITINLDYADEEHEFTIADFTTVTTPVYSDPEGDGVETVKILTLPTTGTLYLSGVPVNVNDEITLADIVAGNLTYDIDLLETGGYTDSTMTFNIADDGSSSYGAITPGVVTFVVGAEINLPPDVVGDETIAVTYAATYVYTAADFTTNTTPAYNDPEADAAEDLKILSLPASGSLKYNGAPCSVNQIVSFADITAGLLQYTADNGTLIAHTDPWNFAIADAGSGTFSS